MNIGIEGAKFTLDGQQVHLAGCDAYTLYQHYLAADPVADAFMYRVRDMFAETADAPFLRMLRVFFMYDGTLGQFHPQETPGFYERIPEFLDWIARWGFGCLAEVFADTKNVMRDVGQQRVHWSKMGSAFRQRAGHVIVQLGNELDHDTQDIDHRNFSELRELICSKGSMTSGVYPAQPFWRACDYHPRRNGIKGQASCGRYLPFVVGGDPEATPPFPGTYRPTLISEWRRIDDNPQDDTHTNDMGQCYRAGADAALWGAGIVIHCLDGMYTRVLSDTQFNCGKAMLMGMSKIDPVFRFGA